MLVLYAMHGGARWLLAGVGCTLATYWLLMLVVMVIFLLGGLAYTEFCRSVVYFEDERSQMVLAYVRSLGRGEPKWLQSGPSVGPWYLSWMARTDRRAC